MKSNQETLWWESDRGPTLTISEPSISFSFERLSLILSGWALHFNRSSISPEGDTRIIDHDASCVCFAHPDHERGVQHRSQSITIPFSYSPPPKKLLWIQTNDDIFKCGSIKEIESHFPQPGSPDVRMNKTYALRRKSSRCLFGFSSTWSVAFCNFACKLCVVFVRVRDRVCFYQSVTSSYTSLINSQTMSNAFRKLPARCKEIVPVAFYVYVFYRLLNEVRNDLSFTVFLLSDKTLTVSGKVWNASVSRWRKKKQMSSFATRFIFQSIIIVAIVYCTNEGDEQVLLK